MTAEDPVEYNFAGLNQVQVKEEVGLTFASALKSFLRQDPDIIMIGEVRDLGNRLDCRARGTDGSLGAVDSAYELSIGNVHSYDRYGDRERFLVSSSVNLGSCSATAQKDLQEVQNSR
jgi:hypothetical protein